MSKINSTLTASLVRELVNYDPETGIMIRRVDRPPRWKAGQTMGWNHSSGYTSVMVGPEQHLMHRVVWLYMTGEWPIQFIDHIDGNRRNNRFANLRQADSEINLQNLKTAKRHSKTQVLGVSPHGSGFRAQICVDGITRPLGTFRTPEEAYAVYLNAKRLNHPGNTL